jgi:hypothetical protein
MSYSLLFKLESQDANYYDIRAPLIATPAGVSEQGTPCYTIELNRYGSVKICQRGAEVLTPGGPSTSACFNHEGRIICGTLGYVKDSKEVTGLKYGGRRRSRKTRKSRRKSRQSRHRG